MVAERERDREREKRERERERMRERGQHGSERQEGQMEGVNKGNLRCIKKKNTSP